MPSLLDRLSAVCREHLLREKILVVPSLAIGHQIADAIAHGGTPWVNLRVETMRTIADAVAGFALAKEGITVLSRAQALALIERACDRVLGSSSYFGALADRPGLHRAIQKSIDDLRHANVPITPASFEDPRKGEDLARILAAYEEELQKGRYIDRFGVLARAISMAPRPTDALWIAVEDLELTAAEERLLDSVSSVTLWCKAFHHRVTESTEFRRAVGEENELRGAFRSILDERIPFDNAEIVYTTRDPYLPLAYELAAEYEIPCTFAEGIAAHFTRPGQAALAFLRWIGEGFHAVDLQRAARAGAFATPGFARILRRARIGWGRDRYLKRIEDPEAREIIQELLAMSEGVSFARATARFVAKFAHVRNEVDAMAREALRRMLDELDTVGASLEDASRLSEAVRNVHVAASNPRPGFLHVAPMRAGGWSARSRMFVAGLDESKHPGSGLQDPIILDIEREAIGIPIVGDRPERSTEQFHRLLGRASNRQITLSYASLALKDRRERFPSSSLLEMYRASNDKPNATYEQVAGGIAREGFIDKVPLSGSDWWLSQQFSGAPVSSPAAAYPNLAAGARAEAARESDEITRWDGRIAAPAEELDPRRNGRVYSASQIEKMAGCPYRHFLERILGIRPLDEIAYEQDTWLEANEFGTLMHELLQVTMNELCAAGRKPSMSFLPRMQEITEQALARWRDDVPPPSEAAFEKRRKDLLDSAEIFLRTEEEACRTVTPKHFEWEFGEPDPFILPLGRGASIRLRGQIDRIDHDETNDEWHVWDYKSGGTYQFDRGGVLACGTKIQHAIYARAAAAILTGRVTRSGYLFPTTKGGGARLARECTDRELTETLDSLFDVVATGFFPHGTADTCRFCDFQSVCGPAAERLERKLNSNANDPAVKAWLKLQDIK